MCCESGGAARKPVSTYYPFKYCAYVVVVSLTIVLVSVTVLVTLEGCNAAIEALKQAHAADMLVAAYDFRVTHLGVTTGTTGFPAAAAGASVVDVV